MFSQTPPRSLVNSSDLKRPTEPLLSFGTSISSRAATLLPDMVPQQHSLSRILSKFAQNSSSSAVCCRKAGGRMGVGRREE